MVWILAILLVALSFSPFTIAKCSTRISEKIKALNLKNENILNTIDGEYRFVFFSIGKLNGKSRGSCVRLRFLKEEDTHKMEYVGVLNGKYEMKLVDGVIQQIGPQGKVDMHSYIIVGGPDVVALYTCSTSESPEPTLTYVAVSVKAENAKEKYDKARESLASVGIKTGVEMPACLNSDGEPTGGGGGGALGDAMANVASEAIEDEDADEEEEEGGQLAREQEHQHERALDNEREHEQKTHDKEDDD